MRNLFEKYLQNRCSPEEIKELLRYFNAIENGEQLRNLIHRSLESLDENDIENEWSEAEEETYQRIKKQFAAEKVKSLPAARKVWFRVAAAIVLIIGLMVLYRFAGDQKKSKPEIVNYNSPTKDDIAPGSSRAVLTLNDGTQIMLDSTANGSLANQGNTSLVKLDGRLEYSAGDNKATEVFYNVVSTPRGGKYRLILADGSKVWLNAASSLRFPATFVGKERRVELTGEGYFEVAKNASMPFKVMLTDKGEVEVLGTHFNIKSYADDPISKTTLLEGKVKVFKGKSIAMLLPGQQAQISGNNNIKIDRDADVEEAVAWKNGLFNFQNKKLEEVMNELARWYDLEIVYSSTVPDITFIGAISRDMRLSDMLKTLEQSEVHYKIDRRKLIVLP